MALSRPDLLGSAILLWAMAGLLALCLLCNPAAAALAGRVGPTRSWGAVLGLGFLGLALAGQRPALCLLPLAALSLLLLPGRWASLLGPAALAAAGLASALGSLTRRPARTMSSGAGRHPTSRSHLRRKDPWRGRSHFAGNRRKHRARGYSRPERRRR